MHCCTHFDFLSYLESLNDNSYVWFVGFFTLQLLGLSPCIILKTAVILVQRSTQTCQSLRNRVVLNLDFSSSAMPPVKREGSGAIGGRKAASCFRQMGLKQKPKSNQRNVLRRCTR